MADTGSSAARAYGFTGLGQDRPAGALAAYGHPAAAQAAIRGDAQNGEFMAAAEATLGVALPTTSRIAQTEGPISIFRLGPDNWLAVHDADAGFGQAAESAQGFHGIDLSSSRARLRLEGPEVRDLLSVGARVDLRASAFIPGAFAQTPVGSATALLHCRAENAFDVYIARSLSESWLVWLRHAGQEFGLSLAE